MISAAHRREPRELPRLERLQRPAATALVAFSLAYMLTAFPVYPSSWTLPLAGLIALIAWRRPVAGVAVAAALCLPAFWNYSQAGALVYAPLMVAWIQAGRKMGTRVLVPLTAIPLTPGRHRPGRGAGGGHRADGRRRAAEAAAGGLVAIVTGPLIAHQAARALPSADSPLVYLQALAGSPGTVLVWLAMIAFGVLLPLAWARRGRAGCRRWRFGESGSRWSRPACRPRLPATPRPSHLRRRAAALVAILPAASALAAPRIRLGR